MTLSLGKIVDYHKVAIATVGVVLCFGIASVTALVALGRDPSQVLYLIAAVAAPTIPSLLNLTSSETIKSKVAKVERNTNGNLNRVLDHNAMLTELLKQSGVEVPTLEGKPRYAVEGE